MDSPSKTPPELGLQLPHHDSDHAKTCEVGPTPTAAKSISLMSLPNEILLDVFGFTYLGKGDYRRHCDHPDYPDQKGSDVKNCRLVCRRFHDISSRLLISSVAIDCRISSLARLDAISRHPIIAKGVESIQVSLAVFTPSVGASLVDLISRYQLAIKPSHPIHSAWGKLRQFLQHEDSKVADENILHLLFFKMVQKAYRQLCEEQDFLSQSGNFAKLASPAILRMPRVRMLSFHDNLPLSNRDDHKDMAELLEERCRHTFCPDGIIARGFDNRPTWLAVELPAALQAAGASIEAVDIRFGTFKSDPFCLPASSTVGPRDAAANLRTFSLKVSDEPSLSSHAHISSYLSAFTSAGKLESLYLELQQWHMSDTMDARVLELTTKVLTDCRLENVRELKFAYVMFDFAAFEKFLSKRVPALKSLGLVRVGFFDDERRGTAWPQALEILRRKSLDAVKLQQPSTPTSSAEDKWVFSLILNRLCMGFPHPRCYHTRAELYVLGYLDTNPFHTFRSDKDDDAWA
ncbi:hypothetical protein QBC34DRAFT_473014 [Podospora aff. communis PSN243]|uniref:F-box domain-containing protein n=1 Tax=Podospora aff. communis PSN243 TaxID=3040156 RepID=A0AAV9GCL9_9PEZI|nr:hypothetical protein QBC34DRAFT_473014 [Podospora aff. communis PSN243]